MEKAYSTFDTEFRVQPDDIDITYFDPFSQSSRHAFQNIGGMVKFASTSIAPSGAKYR